MTASLTGRKIRIALVGCGRIARNHLSAIEYFHEFLELVAVCDVDQERLDTIMEGRSVCGYRDIETMLSESSADLVVLTTPSGLHAKQAREVARKGKHVLTEKPMATKWIDGLDMVACCEEAGVRLFVVKQNRLNPTVKTLKSAILNGRFGRIYNIAVNVFWTRPQEYYDADLWRGTWELDGGALMNQASHYVDLLYWLFGPVDSVSAFTATQARRIEAEDSGVATILWRSGALGTLNVSMLTYPKNLEGSITVIGEFGTAKVGGVALNKIEVWDFAEKQPHDEKIKSLNYETSSVYGNGHIDYYKSVIDNLRGNSATTINGEQGLRSLEILTGLYVSAREQKIVKFPMEGRVEFF